MKKIFTLLTAILLMFGATRALAATFTWSQFDGSTYKAKYTATGMKIYRLTWSSENLYMNMSFDEEKAGSYNGDVMPEPGYYTISTSGSSGKKVSAYRSTWYGSNYTNSGYYSGGSYYKFYSGGLYVEEGSDGPHIYTSSNITTTPDGYNASDLSLQIGSSATYRTVGVTENDNSMGTASYEIKSGYVYTTVDGTYVKHWKNGSTYTLTATPTSDNYRFVEWRKGNTVISSYPNNVVDVVIDGNATYTAYFEWAHVPEAGTISATADHGTVTVNQPSTNGGTAVTLSVTADDGYVFTGWDDDNDGVIDNTDNPRTVYVDGDKNYTALFVEGTKIYVEDGVLYVSNSGSGYFFFEGKSSDNYCFHFETYNTSFAEGEFSGGAIDQNCTKLYYPAYSTQIGINFGTLTASVSKEYVTATMYKYVLSAVFQDTEGNTYDVTIKAIGPMKADCVDAMDNTTIGANDAFTTDVKILTMSDNRYRLRADGGNWSGMSYGYDTRIDFIISDDDMTDAVPPVGTYPITYTLDSKTVSMPEYPNLTCSSSYDLSSLNTAFNGSIMRQFYLNSGANISQMWWKFLCGGTVSVTKVGSTYTYAISAITSKADPNNTYPASYYTVNYYVSGSTYQVVLAAEDENGNSISNGAPVYVAYNRDYGKHFVPGTYNFFSNAEIKLVASDNAAYEFVKWKDNDSEEGARTETVTGVSTYTAVFRSNATPRTITLSSDANGTVTVHNENTNADVVFTENTASVLDGTTLTISAEGITGYHCTGITVNDEPLVGSTYTVDGDFVIAATFAPNTNTAYTVKHYQQNLTLDGYTEVEGDRQNLTGTTAASTAAVAQTYTGFTAQSFEQGTIAGDETTVVSIYYNRDKYTVSLAVSPADYGTVSQESVTDVPYGAVIAIGTDENANKVTINGIPVTAAMEFYSFVEWQNTTSVDPVSLSAGSSFNLSGDVSLTAVFELPETIVLRDDFENNSRWQTDYAALRTTLTVNGKVAKRDVQLKRTFNAGRWSTISLPFAYNFSKQGNNTFKGQVYYLISAKYTEQGYLKLNCMPNTYRIEPNKPYIVIPNETIVNPVFNDVTLQSIGDGSYTVENTENIGTGVTFRNTQYRQTLPNNDKRVIYLSSNTLCYPHPEKETYMNAFRGYFYLNVEVEDIHYIQPRRVILETTDGDRIEYAEESNEAISSETHKYIENGILVIERNGIKYDAQGHIIK